MGLLHTFKCVFGIHTRGPRSKTWVKDGLRRSYCRGCGVELVRDFRGWHPIRNQRLLSHRKSHKHD